MLGDFKPALAHQARAQRIDKSPLGWTGRIELVLCPTDYVLIYVSPDPPQRLLVTNDMLVVVALPDCRRRRQAQLVDALGGYDLESADQAT